jgi:hypothetical protein
MADSETIPTPRDDAAPAGLVLGYVRLQPPTDALDLVGRLCGGGLGGELWAMAVTDGRGGLCWAAPICYRCRTREGAGRTTEPERTRRLAALASKLAELTVRREVTAGPAEKPEPKSGLRLRRKRPATPAAQPIEPPGPPPASDVPKHKS